MRDLTKLKFNIIKTDDGEFYNRDLKKLNKLMDTLEPGSYTLQLTKTSSRLVEMKKFYFSMETHISNHLGMSKDDLHKDLKKVFRKFDSETEEEVYDSVADIQDEEEMLARIIRLQEHAGKYLGYEGEPYSED
jgi:hypothetical protein